MYKSRNNGFGHPIYVQIPRIKKPIPLFVIFRSLNIISDRDIGFAFTDGNAGSRDTNFFHNPKNY